MPAMQSHGYLTPIRGMPSLNLKNIPTVPIVTSLTNNLLIIVQCNSEIYKNSFSPRTIIDWNHLDDNIVRADTVDGFRKAVHYWN